MILYLFLVLLIGIIVWRIILPNMKIVPRTKSGNGTPFVDSSIEKKKGASKKYDWFKKNLWTILFVIAGVIVFFYGISSSWKMPDLASVGKWSWSHWFWILIFCGIAYALIRVNDAKSSKTTETFKTLLIVAIPILFIGCPVIGWFTNHGSTNQRTISAQANIPLVSAPATEWPEIVLLPGKSEKIPRRRGMYIILHGHRATLHVVYADGNEFVAPIESNEMAPSGQIVDVYVTNEMKNETNIISFAYAYPK